MGIAQIGALVAACIVSAGGIGGILIAVIRFSSNLITERLSSKYSSELEKALEKYKTELNKKEYVSKTKFDAEFRIYQELSEKNISMVYCAGKAAVISSGAPYPSDELNSFIKEYCNRINDAEITNRRYAPFISDEIYGNIFRLKNNPRKCFVC